MGAVSGTDFMPCLNLEFTHEYKYMYIQLLHDTAQCSNCLQLDFNYVNMTGISLKFVKEPKLFQF